MRKDLIDEILRSIGLEKLEEDHGSSEAKNEYSPKN